MGSLKRALDDHKWGVCINGRWCWFTIRELLSIARRTVEAQEAAAQAKGTVSDTEVSIRGDGL